MAIKRKIPERGSREYNEALRQVGDLILRMNKEGKNQRFSTYLIERTVGDQFYRTHCKGYENLERTLEDLKKLGKRFSEIEISEYRKTWGWGERWTEEEKQIVEQAHQEAQQEGHIYAHILERLKAKGYDRNITQLAGILGRKRGIKEPLTKGSPHYRKKKSPLEKTIEKAIETAEDEHDEEEIEEITGSPKNERDNDREKYFRYASIGHQNLLAFLMDPENYIRYVGKNMRLITVDFRQEDIREELFNAVKDKIPDLESLVEEDKEVTEIVDRALRCDMIFKKKDGSYTVVEVKQNAVDTEEHKNATKARQQAGRYWINTLSNVISRNVRYRDKTGYMPLVERVEAIITAYNISDELKDELEAHGAAGLGTWRPIEVARQEVNEYINRVLEQYKRTKTKPRVKKPKIKTGKQKVRRKPSIRAEEISETQEEISETPKESPRIIELENRKRNFAALRQRLAQTPDGLLLGTYNKKEHAVEIRQPGEREGVLYVLDGRNGRDYNPELLIKECIGRGVLRLGHINIMKYQERVQI